MMESYYQLGNHSRPITTSSAAAQQWFDRGLIWCYGFNHEEAERCFERALAHDQNCAMAHWGIGYANGPFYNKPWKFYAPHERPGSIKRCHEAAQAALQLSPDCSPAEIGLIDALCSRYPSAHEPELLLLDGWDDAYAAAMRRLYQLFPTDLDIISLFAEAMMTRTPWALWDLANGQPATNADTREIIELLEHGLSHIASNSLPPHPGIAHLYIHALEMSPFPEKALSAADDLRDLVPDSGHLCHMPGHIDVLCGHYYHAVAASEKAIAADNLYLAQVGPFGFYTSACCHDLHLMMYAAMFLGQYGQAKAAADSITTLLTEKVLRSDKPHLASTLEGYYSMAMHAEVRFGQWQTIIDAKMPTDSALYPVTTAMFHYAKGVAYAAGGQINEALAQQAAFEQARGRIPHDRRFFNNAAADVLGVAEAMLAGELSYRQEHYEVAFNHLREAVRRDDNLAYTEPWAWMHPPRHALGALLLEQGHVAEAKAVYQADLGLNDSLKRSSQHPDNVWSLHGYVECLDRLGEGSEATMMRARLDIAQARADVNITASCACRLECHHTI